MKNFEQGDAKELKQQIEKDVDRDASLVNKANDQLADQAKSNEFWAPLQVPHREAELRRASEAKEKGETVFSYERTGHLGFSYKTEKEIDIHIKDLEYEIAGLENKRPPDTDTYAEIQNRITEGLSDIKNLRDVLDKAEGRIDKIKTNLKSAFDPMI